MGAYSANFSGDLKIMKQEVAIQPRCAIHRLQGKGASPGTQRIIQAIRKTQLAIHAVTLSDSIASALFVRLVDVEIHVTNSESPKIFPPGGKSVA